jgi:diacylglycerol kinase family enzyme
VYTADAARAGIDGEAVELSPPVECKILPGALRVRISARHPGVSPSGALP